MKTVMFLLVLQFLVQNGFGQVPAFIPSEKAGITEVSDISNFYGHGAAAADYDNDGDIDFFLGTKSGLKDRLYRNDGNGVFTDVATSVGLIKKESSRMALWVDYNADGLLDLVNLIERCANFKCGQPILLYLYEQQADGTFLEVSDAAGLEFGDKYDNIEVYSIGGMAAGDLNNDEYMDLIVAVWGGKMTVFFNNGNGTFSDQSVSTALGLEANYYWQPMIHDFNHDGWMDIFSNVDFGPNEFWQNDGNGNFTEIAKQIGLAVDHSEMGMTLGDFDKDGDLDVYSTNITRMFQGEQEHNVLLRNDSEAGFLVFTEVAESYKVDRGGWDWGTTFIDFNNDGWLDLAATNGWNNDPDWGPDQSHMWLNTNGTYTDVSVQAGFNDMFSATTLITFDMDRDGDLDLLQTLKDNESTNLPAILYENMLEQINTTNNYVVIRPRMPGPNRFAIGSIVRFSTNELVGMHLISAGTSFFGQEPAEAFFGLGANEMVEEVRIEWPNGLVSVYEDIEANQEITLDYEVIGTPRLLNANYTGEGMLIQWLDESDNETGFVLQRSVSPDFETITEFNLEANEVEYTDTGASGSVWYRIKARNASVSSPFSDVLRASTITGIEDEPTLDDMEIFPNPSENIFRVKLSNDWYGPVEILLFDPAGRLLYSQEHQKDSRNFGEQFQLDLSTGLYQVILTAGGKRYQRKLVVSR